MDQIKQIIADPFSWLFGVGIAAILGVWWSRMTATTANATLVIGIGALTAAALFAPWLKHQPIAIKLAWMAVIAGGLVTAAYYTLWTSFIPVQINASTQAANQPKGTVIGGIKWNNKFLLLRLFITNVNRRTDYESLDIVVKSSVPITAAGQVSNIDGVTFWFDSLPNSSAEFANTDTGERVALDLAPIASSRGFRVRSNVIPKSSQLELVFAVVSMNDGMANNEADKMLRVNFSDGTSVWSASPAHTDWVFGPKPKVTEILVKGQYQISGKPMNIDLVLQTPDVMAKALDSVRMTVKHQ
jgi:hypothetical protein